MYVKHRSKGVKHKPMHFMDNMFYFFLFKQKKTIIQNKSKNYIQKLLHHSFIHAIHCSLCMLVLWFSSTYNIQCFFFKYHTHVSSMGAWRTNCGHFRIFSTFSAICTFIFQTALQQFSHPLSTHSIHVLHTPIPCVCFAV